MGGLMQDDVIASARFLGGFASSVSAYYINKHLNMPGTVTPVFFYSYLQLQRLMSRLGSKPFAFNKKIIMSVWSPIRMIN